MKLTKKQLEEKLEFANNQLEEVMLKYQDADGLLAKLKAKESEAKVAKSKLTKFEKKVTEIENNYVSIVKPLEDKVKELQSDITALYHDLAVSAHDFTEAVTKITELQATEATMSLTITQANNTIKDYEYIHEQMKEQQAKLVECCKEMDGELSSKNLFSSLKRWYKNITSTSSAAEVIYTILIFVGLLTIGLTSSFGISCTTIMMNTKAVATWVFTIMNILYTSGTICLMGYFRDWHITIKDMFSKKA